MYPIQLVVSADRILCSNFQAALPQGIVPFVFAKEYNVHPDILSTGFDTLNPVLNSSTIPAELHLFLEASSKHFRSEIIMIVLESLSWDHE